MAWYSYVVAVILLISSVISPWLVNKQNNKYQLTIKKLDMYEDSKRKALSEFIECAQDYLLNFQYTDQTVKYYSSLNKLFIYFSNINLETFIPFENACKDFVQHSFFNFSFLLFNWLIKLSISFLPHSVFVKYVVLIL